MPTIQHNLDDIGRQLGQLIQRYARRAEQDIDRVMQQQIGELRNDIIQGWPVDTGASRAAWQGPIKRGHAHYELVNDIVYARIIEYGGYRGVGAKTSNVGSHTLPGGIQVNGGIYPTQRPAAPVRRALSKRNTELRTALAKVI